VTSPYLLEAAPGVRKVFWLDSVPASTLSASSWRARRTFHTLQNSEINNTVIQGVTKRCRLSWLTNRALVYEPKYGGGGGVAESRPMSTAVHRSPKTNSTFKLCSYQKLCKSQCFGSGFIEFGSGSSILAGYRSGSRVLMTKNWGENLIYFLIKKTAFYLSLSLHKGRSSYRRGLQPSKEIIQHFKT
jgi:hypothetical protein